MDNGKEVTEIGALRLGQQLKRTIEIPLGLSNSSRGRRESGSGSGAGRSRPQFPRLEQVLSGARKVIPLAEDLTHPDVHIRCAATNEPSRIGGKVQSPLIDAPCLAETALA